jgi:hypothetical protein
MSFTVRIIGDCEVVVGCSDKMDQPLLKKRLKWTMQHPDLHHRGYICVYHPDTSIAWNTNNFTIDEIVVETFEHNESCFLPACRKESKLFVQFLAEQITRLTGAKCVSITNEVDYVI